MKTNQKLQCKITQASELGSDESPNHWNTAQEFEGKNVSDLSLTVSVVQVSRRDFYT